MFYDFQLSKNLSFEIQLEWNETHWQYFNFNIRWSRKTDHAGLKFNLQIYKLYFNIDIYDHRHWDYDNDCWQENYPED